MSTLTFYGASDDLIEIDSTAGRVEVLDRDGGPSGDNETNGENAEFLIEAPDGRKGIVSVDYMSDGTWRLGFRPADEYTPSFDGKFGVMTMEDRGYPPGAYRGYSGKLVIDVPDGTTITRHDAGE